MKTQKSDLIKNIEEICEKTRFFFVNRYFGKDVKSYWEANQVGNTLYVGDYSFDIYEMLEYLRNSASREQLFGHVEHIEEEYQLDRTPLTFKHYKENLMRHK
jgi:hypothetical protein